MGHPWRPRPTLKADPRSGHLWGEVPALLLRSVVLLQGGQKKDWRDLGGNLGGDRGEPWGMTLSTGKLWHFHRPFDHAGITGPQLGGPVLPRPLTGELAPLERPPPLPPPSSIVPDGASCPKESPTSASDVGPKEIGCEASVLAAELLEAGQAFVEDIQSRAVAQANAIIIAKGDARNRGHLVARQ